VEHFSIFFAKMETTRLETGNMRSFLSLLGALDAAATSVRFSGHHS